MAGAGYGTLVAASGARGILVFQAANLPHPHKSCLNVGRFDMVCETKTHRRRSIRLSEYDYSQEGAYFVTMCTRNRAPWLNTVAIAELVRKQWLWLAEQYEYVELDQFVIMPNHIHGILLLIDDRTGGSRTAPTKPTRATGEPVAGVRCK